MALEAQTFSNITPEKFKSLSDTVKSKTGITIDQPNGVDSQGGWRVRWAYDQTNFQLVVQVLSKPWYAPEGKVQSSIRDWVTS